MFGACGISMFCSVAVVLRIMYYVLCIMYCSRGRRASEQPCCGVCGVRSVLYVLHVAK